jgi:putative PIN family toxin of toxin-antitoxin system
VRFTLDSNILVRAVTSPRGPALRLLDLILGSHSLVVSRFILDEVERGLLYPRLQARYRITIEEVARFTDNLANAAHVVEPTVVMPITVSDPADDPVLYTAADGNADVLCTLNTRHFSTSAVQPLDPEEPVVCLDEKPVTPHADVRPTSPAEPGREARRDNENERRGPANVFCAVAPKAGRHFTYPTPDRSAVEFAKVIFDLVTR